MTDEKSPLTRRPELMKLPPTDKQHSYLLEVYELEDGPMLEVYELEDGPIGTGQRHAVWLHRLKTGGYRWECSCGEQRSHRELDAALLAEARAHFDQVGSPTAQVSFLRHLACVWDRAAESAPPDADGLEQLARDLRMRDADITPIKREPIDVVHLCGLCGQTFRIAPDDPHWSTGRGPICPSRSDL